MSDKEIKEGMRRDSVSRVNRIRAKRIEEENNYTGKDKLEFDIGNLKTTIMNCELDLNTSELKGNLLIIRKLETAKARLIVKEEEYKTIVGKPTQEAQDCGVKTDGSDTLVEENNGQK